MEMQARGDGVLRWSEPTSQGVDVARKLAERADAFVGSHQEQAAELRRLFCVRLAHVPQQGSATRKAFFLDDEDVTDIERHLVRELADQRILSTGERDGRAVAEVAHEALFSAWATLRQWIETRRELYAWATQLAAERKDWEARGKANSALLTGRPLERASGYDGNMGTGGGNLVPRPARPGRRRRALPDRRWLGCEACRDWTGRPDRRPPPRRQGSLTAP